MQNKVHNGIFSMELRELKPPSGSAIIINNVTIYLCLDLYFMIKNTLTGFLNVADKQLTE